MVTTPWSLTKPRQSRQPLWRLLLWGLGEAIGLVRIGDRVDRIVDSSVKNSQIAGAQGWTAVVTSNDLEHESIPIEHRIGGRRKSKEEEEQ